MAAKNFMNSSNASQPVRNDAAGLELPDWNGMKIHEVRMSPAEAFRWNEEMLALFSTTNKLRRDPNRSLVEFKL